MKRLIITVLAVLAPAAALASAADKPLTGRDYTEPRPNYQLQHPKADTPPIDGMWVQVWYSDDTLVSVFVQHGFPMPYPLCKNATKPLDACIVDGTPRPRP